MDEPLVNKLFESFDQLDENELTLVLNQVARRMLYLRAGIPDAATWYGILMRVNKWLATEPFVNEAEKKMLCSPPSNLGGRIKAIKSMRERSGANMSACMEIVDKWIREHLDIVDENVKASYLSCEKNLREAKEKRDHVQA